MGQELIEGKLKIRENFEAKFKLQAYASHLFNEYLKERIRLEAGSLKPEET